VRIYRIGETFCDEYAYGYDDYDEPIEYCLGGFIETISKKILAFKNNKTGCMYFIVPPMKFAEYDRATNEITIVTEKNEFVIELEKDNEWMQYKIKDFKVVKE